MIFNSFPFKIFFILFSSFILLNFVLFLGGGGGAEGKYEEAGNECEQDTLCERHRINEKKIEKRRSPEAMQMPGIGACGLAYPEIP